MIKTQDNNMIALGSSLDLSNTMTCYIMNVINNTW